MWASIKDPAMVSFPLLSGTRSCRIDPRCHQWVSRTHLSVHIQTQIQVLPWHDNMSCLHGHEWLLHVRYSTNDASYYYPVAAWKERELKKLDAFVAMEHLSGVFRWCSRDGQRRLPFRRTGREEIIKVLKWRTYPWRFILDFGPREETSWQADCVRPCLCYHE